MAAALERAKDEARRHAAEAALSAERARSAQARAAELARTNAALRQGISGLARLAGLDRFLGEMLRAAVGSAGAHTGAVVLLADGGHTYRFAALLRRDGQLTPGPELPGELPITPGLERFIARITGSPEGWPLAPDDPRHEPPLREVHAAEGNRALRHVPMRAGARLLGWLRLGYAEAEPAFGGSYALLQTLADQMSLAVELTRLAEQSQAVAVVREGERAAEERAAELERANAALRGRGRLISAVSDVLKGLLGSEDFEVAVGGALRRLGEALGIHRVKVILPRADPGGGPLDHELVHEWWAPGLASQRSLGLTRFAHDQLPAYLTTLQAGQPLWQFLEDVPEHFREPFARVGMRSMGVVPVLVGGEYAGMVAFDDCVERRVWSAAEMEALTIAARAIGAAIHRREMEQVRVRELLAERERAAGECAAELVRANAALRRGVERLAGEQHIGAILGAFLAEAVATVSASGAGAVMLRVADTATTFEPAAVWDEGLLSPAVIASHPYLGRYTELSGADPAGIFTALARGTMPSYPVEDLRQSVPLAYAYHRERGHRAIWHAPLLLRGEVLGFLALALPEEHLPDEAARETVAALAQQLVLALELTRLAALANQGAVLEERNRIARELHDIFAQGFTGIVVQLEGAENATAKGETDKARARLARARELARESLGQVRRSVHALRPTLLDGRDLPAALGELVRAMTEDTPLATTVLRVEGRPRPLPDAVEEHLLRICQEALTNVLKHARASHAEVVLDYPDYPPEAAAAFHLHVRDDGVGFRPGVSSRPVSGADTTAARAGATPGLGLIGMRERAARIGARLSTESAPGRGTTVSVHLPLPPGDPL